MADVQIMIIDLSTFYHFILHLLIKNINRKEAY